MAEICAGYVSKRKVRLRIMLVGYIEPTTQVTCSRDSTCISKKLPTLLLPSYLLMQQTLQGNSASNPVVQIHRTMSLE